jgi:BirA family biotin operon repressor/biotin-[acetyl-CoA-carboxylase] ligase
LAAQEAIRQVTGIGCDLRWPNDLLLGERKCGGILVQLHGNRIVSGIGININQVKFPPELVEIATSLRTHTGQKIPKDKLLLTILAEIADYCGLLEKKGRDSILRLFAESSSYVYGRSVVVDSAEAVVAGTTDGLDESGFLWIRADDGRRHLIRAGGVRPR